MIMEVRKNKIQYHQKNCTFNAFKNLAVPLCAIVPRQSTSSWRVMPIPVSLYGKSFTSWRTKRQMKAEVAAYKTYVIVITPLSLSVWIRISRSTESFMSWGSVTLRNRSLSNASLALLRTKKTKFPANKYSVKNHGTNRKDGAALDILLVSTN